MVVGLALASESLAAGERPAPKRTSVQDASGLSLRLLSLDKIMREPLPPVEWDVEPLVVRGDRVLLYAEWGAFKTWIALDLALSLAAGRSWLGQFEVPAPRRVLYVDEEMKESTLRRRIRRLGAGLGYEAGAADVPFRVLSRQGVRLDGVGARTLLEALTEAKFLPQVIVFDTYRRVAGGEENEASDVAAF